MVGGAALTEDYRAFDARIERMVASHPDVVARMHPGTALAHQDAAGRDQLAAEALDPQALGF